MIPTAGLKMDSNARESTQKEWRRPEESAATRQGRY